MNLSAKDNKKHSPPDKLWPVYAFRAQGGHGWKLVANDQQADNAREAALTRFQTVDEWHATGHTLYSPASSGLWIVREDEDINLQYPDDRPTFVWDPYAQVWRTNDEPITAPPYAEAVENVVLTFSQPNVGWIKMCLRTGTQRLDLMLSAVFDPFDGAFTDWLERAITREHARLVVDTEGTLALLHLLPSGERDIYLVGRPIYDGCRDFIVKMPRRTFISDFYLALVTFWEGDELKRNWTEWLTDVKYPEYREDYDPRYWQPFSIRSAAIEEYLASAA